MAIMRDYILVVTLEIAKECTWSTQILPDMTTTIHCLAIVS